MRKGFSLIEMLVVISITAVLAGLTLAGVGMIRKQARDTQRKSDLQQYRNALESFASINNGRYPSFTTPPATHSELCASLLSVFGAENNCPIPPSTPTDAVFSYFCVSDGKGGGSVDALKYALYTRLETTTSNRLWVVCSSGKSGIVIDPVGLNPDNLCSF